MFRYAQIDENGICYAESRLLARKRAKNLVPLAPDEEVRLGQRWNGKAWEPAG